MSAPTSPPQNLQQQPPATYEPTASTTATRHQDRVGYDRAAVHAVLDEALVCHVGLTAPDGTPRVLPMLHARRGDTLYLHGSSGAAAALAARGGELPVCATVTLVDALVLARAAMHHSTNYRSVVAIGRARRVDDETEKRAALATLLDHVSPGRSDQCRPPSARELAATSVLALPLVEVSLKCREGDPSDDEQDLALPWWAGTVPVAGGLGEPRAAANLTADAAAPAARPAGFRG